VWSGACKFDNRIAFDFEVAGFDDEETKCLSMSIQKQPSRDGKIGAGLILHNNYELKHTVVIEPDAPWLDQHEFNIIQGGKRALTATHRSVLFSGHDLGLSQKLWLDGDGFQELDVETGDRVFEWTALDHLSLRESTYPGPREPLKYDEGFTWDAL
jgi:hypothetical protein